MQPDLETSLPRCITLQEKKGLSKTNSVWLKMYKPPPSTYPTPPLRDRASLSTASSPSKIFPALFAEKLYPGCRPHHQPAGITPQRPATNRSYRSVKSRRAEQSGRGLCKYNGIITESVPPPPLPPPPHPRPSYILIQAYKVVDTRC